MKLDVKDVIEIIEREKKVLKAVINASECVKDLEDQERLITRYEERVSECNLLIITFNALLENKEIK